MTGSTGSGEGTEPGSVPLQTTLAAARALRDRRAVILVEGRSDEEALRVLARRRGRDLVGEGVALLALGGATNAGHVLEVLGPRGAGLELAGLCDAAEVGEVARGLHRAGMEAAATAADLERVGFHVCDEDLEDELIRALGVPGVEEVMAQQGELSAFRTFQKQPFQRGRDVTAQIRRFIGTRSGRKIRYGALLVEALDLDDVPRPLDAVLDRV